jgi:hypothetical protein
MYLVMNMLQRLKCFIATLAGAGLFIACAQAAEDPGSITAAELAGRMAAVQQDGNSYVRMKLDTAGGTLQLEGKQRRGRGGAEVVYRVLFPRDRKGEALLLRPGGGAHFVPPNTLKNLGSGQMDEPFFGSALANADLVENFFAWPQQAIVGNETVDRVNCTILESKPKGGSIYGSVRSWIDTRRMVPLRVEKYSGSGQSIRRIDTTRVVTDDRGKHIPANMSISGPRGAKSDLDGSKIKHDVKFADGEFTPEGLKQQSGAGAE